MKFEIEKIVLYRKHKPGRKVYVFEPGKLNAVIGNSTRGKSTFLKILDYVFGSDNCMVPEAVTSVTEWVGIMFRGEAERTFIARLLPGGEKAAEDIFQITTRPVADEFPIPDRVGMTAKCDEVLRRLDSMVAERAGDGGDAESDSLRFRDLLTLCIQDAETIASENRLFGSMYAGHQAASKLAKRLHSVLGIRSDELGKCIAKRRSAEAEYSAIKEARNKANRLMFEWRDRLVRDLHDAKKCGVLPPDADIPSNPADMQTLLDAAIEKYESGSAPQMSPDVMDGDLVRLNELQQNADRLAFEIDALQHRKAQVENIQQAVEDCRAEELHARGRLQITKFIKQVFNPELGDMFPIAGFSNERKVQDEYKKLCQALDEFDGSVDDRASLEDCRKSFKSEIARISNARDKKIVERNALVKEIKLLADVNRAAKDRIATQRNLYELRGRIASAKQLLLSLVGEGATSGDLQAKHEEIEALKRREVDLVNDLATAKDNAIADISDGISRYVEKMNVPPALKALTPELDENLHDIMLKSASGSVSRLKRMGSLSIHLAYHTALTCSMQEYFAENGSSPVPGFVIYDQPRRSSEETIPLNRAIAQSSGEARWQPIVLAEGGMEELFDPDYAERLHIVADFSGEDDGIVPREWLRRE